MVCYPFRTATLVDNETIEGQIGEGCQADDLLLHVVTVVLHQVAVLDLLEKVKLLACHVCRLPSCAELLHCKALALLVGKKHLAKPPRPQEFGRLVIVR